MSAVYCLELISHIHKPVNNVKFKQAYIILCKQRELKIHKFKILHVFDFT